MITKVSVYSHFNPNDPVHLGDVVYDKKSGVLTLKPSTATEEQGSRLFQQVFKLPELDPPQVNPVHRRDGQRFLTYLLESRHNGYPMSFKDTTPEIDRDQPAPTAQARNGWFARIAGGFGHASGGLTG